MPIGTPMKDERRAMSQPPLARATDSPEMSLILNRARKLIDYGHQRRAMEELWRAETLARGNPEAIHEVLEFAEAFDERVELQQKSWLADLVAALEYDAKAASRPPEKRPNRWAWVGFGVLAALGFWIAYGTYEFLVELEPALDCGWENAYPVGGETAGTTIVPLLGLGLLAAGGFASWRWFVGRRLLLLLGLGALYIGSLVLIWYTLPPGPYHCVWAP